MQPPIGDYEESDNEVEEFWQPTLFDLDQT